MMTLLVQAPDPIRLVTQDAQPWLGTLPLWSWVLALAAGALLVSLMLVRTLGRDRSHDAESMRAFRALARSASLKTHDARVLVAGASESGIPPVACLLSYDAFERVERHAPPEYAQQLGAIRALLFPEIPRA